MLAEAKREAERVVKEARDQQARLISDEEVYKQAERAAEEIIEDARETERADPPRRRGLRRRDPLHARGQPREVPRRRAPRPRPPRRARGRAGRGRLADAADRVWSPVLRLPAELARRPPRTSPARRRARPRLPGRPRVVASAAATRATGPSGCGCSSRPSCAGSPSRTGSSGPPTRWSAAAIWAPPEGWRVPVDGDRAGDAADGQGVRQAAAAGLALAAANGGKASAQAAPLVSGDHGRRPGVAGEGPRHGADAAGARGPRRRGHARLPGGEHPAQPRAVSAQRLRGHRRVQPPLRRPAAVADVAGARRGGRAARQSSVAWLPARPASVFS